MCVPLAVRKNTLKYQRMVLTACGSLLQQEFWYLSELLQVKAGLEYEVFICITHCPLPGKLNMTSWGAEWELRGESHFSNLSCL